MNNLEKIFKECKQINPNFDEDSFRMGATYAIRRMIGNVINKSINEALSITSKKGLGASK